MFAWVVSRVTGTSLLDGRYMLLSLIPFFLAGGWAVMFIKGRIPKLIFISVVCLFCFISSLLPVFIQEGHFARRIPHDWRNALKVLSEKIKPGDGVILRSGLIKEDWLSYTDNPVINEYVKSPLYSFYFNKPLHGIKIANLTFSPSSKFRKYYDKIYADFSHCPRIWIIGIAAPNNFPIKNIQDMFAPLFKTDFSGNFSGVYLFLLKKKSLPEATK